MGLFGYLVAACLLVFAASYARGAFIKHGSFVHDDAFIAMRYARNLASGDGLVWNPGENVEGYTSFLAVILMASMHRLGVELIDAALGLNLLGYVIFVLVLGGFAWRMSPRGSLGALLAAIPGSLALASVSVVVWVLGRLEVPFFLGCISIALIAMLGLLKAPDRRGRVVAAALCLGSLPLVRPDGALFGGVAALAYMVPCIRRGRRGLRSFSLFGAVGLLPSLLHLAFRLAYYGEWIPNTVLAKATGLGSVPLLQGGWQYLYEFVGSPPYLLWMAAVLLPCALLSRANRVAVLYLLGSLLAYAGMIVWVGGDHMVHGRLLLPLLPCAVLLIFYGLAGLADRLGPMNATASIVLAGVGLVAVFGLVPRQDAFAAVRADPAAFVGTIAGHHLQENFPAGTVVALNTAGSTPFFARDLVFIDMLGLNDAHIAKRKITRLKLWAQLVPGHAKGDGQYVLERSPDLIIIGPAEGTEVTRPWFLSDLELMRLPQFHTQYALRKEFIDVRDIPDHEQFAATRTGVMTLTYYEKVRYGAR